MSDPVDALILDLLEWIGPDSRPYPEVIGAWRTSCPRLPVWEEANSRVSSTISIRRVSGASCPSLFWGALSSLNTARAPNSQLTELPDNWPRRVRYQERFAGYPGAFDPRNISH